MKNTALILVTLLYAWQSTGYFISGQYGMGFVILGYTIANIGLLSQVMK